MSRPTSLLTARMQEKVKAGWAVAVVSEPQVTQGGGDWVLFHAGLPCFMEKPWEAEDCSEL